MLLLILLLLEAQDEGSQRERVVAFNVTTSQWALLLRWRAVVSGWSEMNISTNQLIRLALLHQMSDEARACLAPIRIPAPRRKGPSSETSRKLTVTMSKSIEAKLQDLCDRSGGTKSQVMFNCTALLMEQLEDERAARALNASGALKRIRKKPAS